MAGGTWTAQNKVRPGVYANFKAVPAPTSNLGSRGVLTMPVAMSWGPEDTVIELLSTDLLDGKSLSKIGVVATDEEAQIFRLALSNCYKVLLYRLDVSDTVDDVSYGVKASVTAGNLTAVAKYKGTCGNDIAIVIKQNQLDSSLFDVITLYRKQEKDKQSVATVDQLVSNDWVDFNGAGSLVVTPTAGALLTGGVNGVIKASTYTGYLAKIASYRFDTMAIPQDTTASELSTVPALIINQIRTWNEDQGKKCQVVLYDNVSADYECVISSKQGYRTLSETVSPVSFVAYAGGATAGASIVESNTYKVIPEATEIIGALSHEETVTALQQGYLVLSARSNGAIVIEQDINTLKSYNNDRSYAFSKNRVIRTLFSIHDMITEKFETNYLGKVTNNEGYRDIFKADVIADLNSLQDRGAIQNFDSATDITVTAGVDIDAVEVTLAIQPTDSMEKLYVTVNVG